MQILVILKLFVKDFLHDNFSAIDYNVFWLSISNLDVHNVHDLLIVLKANLLVKDIPQRC